MPLMGLLVYFVIAKEKLGLEICQFIRGGISKIKYFIFHILN